MSHQVKIQEIENGLNIIETIDGAVITRFISTLSFPFIRSTNELTQSFQIIDKVGEIYNFPAPATEFLLIDISGVSYTPGTGTELIQDSYNLDPFKRLVENNAIISLGAITTTSNSVNLALSASSVNSVRVNNHFRSKGISDSFSFTAVTSGIKVLILYALDDAQIFYLAQGAQGTQAVEPTIPNDALFISKIYATTTGQVIENPISDTVAKTLSVTPSQLGVATEADITPELIKNYFNATVPIKSEKDFYIITTKADIVYNFDVIGNWGLRSITDSASFKTNLESQGLTNVVVSDFSLVSGRLKANVTITVTGSNYLNLSYLEVTDVKVIAIIGLTDLDFYNNQIVTFNPTIALPSSLTTLYLNNNQIVTFNPTIPLPSGLGQLLLDSNQIVTFNPTIALPSSLQGLSLSNNQIVTFNPTIALPSSLQGLALNYNQIVTFNPMIALPSILTTLDLSYNQIVTFNPTIALPSSLTTLDLSSNQISNWSLSEPWTNSLPNGTTGIYTQTNLTTSTGTNFKAILVSKGYTVNS